MVRPGPGTVNTVRTAEDDRWHRRRSAGIGVLRRRGMNVHPRDTTRLVCRAETARRVHAFGGTREVWPGARLWPRRPRVPARTDQGEGTPWPKKCSSIQTVTTRLSARSRTAVCISSRAFLIGDSCSPWSTPDEVIEEFGPGTQAGLTEGPGEGIRIESSVTSISWIPSAAVAGVTRIPFEAGVAHYDDPPPDEWDDLELVMGPEGARFANNLRVWIEVADGRIVRYGQAGG